MPSLETLPGLSSLGCGYDATGFYASPQSSRFRVFDIGANDTEYEAPNGKKYLRPAGLSFELRDMTKGSFHYDKGTTADEYRTSLTRRAGISANYGLFSSSVTSTYKSEQLVSINREFVTVHHRFDAWSLSLPNYRSLPMNAQANTDINGGISPERVIRDYGTHVLISAIIGGRAEYSCVVDKSKYTSSVETTTAAKAAYSGALNISASYDQATMNAASQFKESSACNFETIGGKFKADFNPVSFTSWMTTFNEHPVMVDFAGNDSLVPIYELARDESRRTALKAAFDKYIQDSQNIVPDNIPAVEVRIVPRSAVQFVVDDSGSHAHDSISFFKPINDTEWSWEGGWRWVGLAGNKQENLIMVRELVPGALAVPHRFKQIWKDSGSGNNSGYSLWNVVPPPGYRTLGNLVRFRVGRTDYDEPYSWDIRGLGCVHESLCVEGKIGNQLWNDTGSHATAAGSIWEIVPNDTNAIDSKTFYCNGSYDKPDEKVYVIRKGNRVVVRQ